MHKKTFSLASFPKLQQNKIKTLQPSAEGGICSRKHKMQTTYIQALIQILLPVWFAASCTTPLHLPWSYRCFVTGRSSGWSKQ